MADNRTIHAGPHGSFTMRELADMAFEAEQQALETNAVLAVINGEGFETFLDLYEFDQHALVSLLKRNVSEVANSITQLKHILEIAEIRP